MKSSKSLESLYNTINQLCGPIEAKKFLSTTMYNVISDLQENGQPVTEEAIEKKLAETATDFLKASKNHVA